jgi:hypothetical protein
MSGGRHAVNKNLGHKQKFAAISANTFVKKKPMIVRS